MQVFDVLADPVRRRIIELLAEGERQAGEVGAVVQAEFGISQPAVSLHLRILRERGFAIVRAAGARRLYSVDPAPLEEVGTWLAQLGRRSTPRFEPTGSAPGRREQGRRAKADARAADVPAKKRKKRSKRKGRKP